MTAIGGWHCCEHYCWYHARYYEPCRLIQWLWLYYICCWTLPAKLVKLPTTLGSLRVSASGWMTQLLEKGKPCQVKQFPYLRSPQMASQEEMSQGSQVNRRIKVVTNMEKEIHTIIQATTLICHLNSLRSMITQQDSENVKSSFFQKQQ